MTPRGALARKQTWNYLNNMEKAGVFYFSLRALSASLDYKGKRMWGFKGLFLALLLLSGLPPLAHAGVNTGLVGDDMSAGPFPIGFTFNYYGQNQTQFFATTNGLIRFGAGSTAYSNSCLPSITNSILPYWDDLRMNVSGQPTGKVFYQTIGEAPNRQLIVQWNNVYFYGSNLPMGTFEAVLYEGSNKIVLQYRYLLNSNSTGSSATIGIQGPSSVATQVGCNQANTIRAEQAIAFTPNGSGSYDVDTNRLVKNPCQTCDNSPITT